MPAKKDNATYVAELLNTEYEALEPYILSNTKILHKHKKCGHTWHITPNNLLTKLKHCPNCAPNSRKSHEYYASRLVDHEMLEPFVNVGTKILHRHRSCGFEWKVSPHDMEKIKTCPKCKDIKRTTEEYKESIKNTEFECLGKYITSQTKILHKHIKCGYEWEVLPMSILQSSGCPSCVKNSSKYLYYIYFPELNLYKVGITNNINTRLNGFGYKAQLLFSQEYNTGSQAYNIEQQILKWLGSRLINTGKLASGNTETFR